jgi:hypothetical protein
MPHDAAGTAEYQSTDAGGDRVTTAFAQHHPWLRRVGG